MRIIALALVAMSLAGGCATTNPDNEYTILEKTSPSGETIFGLACSNGSTTCNYQWDTLCKEGQKPYNTTPLGGKGDEVPSYAVMNGQRVRIFICQ